MNSFPALVRLQRISQRLALGVTVELASRMAELSSQGERLGATASTLYPAMSELSSELVRRAASDSAHLEVIRAHIEGTNRSVTDVTDILKESASHLKGIPTRIEEMAGMIADGTRQGVATAMDQVANEIARKLDGVAATLERSAGAVSTALNESTVRDRQGGEASLDFVKSICQAADEMRKISEESRKLAAALQQAQPSRGNGASKKADGFFRRLWDR